MKDITNFIANYFDDKVDTKVRYVPQNVIVEQDKANVGLPPIFSHNVRYTSNEGTMWSLDHWDHRVAHSYVLSNCGLLMEYER